MDFQQASQQARRTAPKERPTTRCEVVNVVRKGDDKYGMTVRSARKTSVLEVKTSNGKDKNTCGLALSHPGFPAGTTCRMGFSSHSQLMAHKKVIHDLEIYECESCHRLTADGSNYDKHMSTCLGLGRKYECRKLNCTLTFARSDNRVRHERSCRAARASPAAAAAALEADLAASAPAPAPQQLPLPPLPAPVPRPEQEDYFSAKYQQPGVQTVLGVPVTNHLYHTEQAPLFDPGAFASLGAAVAAGLDASPATPPDAPPAAPPATPPTAVPDNTYERSISGIDDQMAIDPSLLETPDFRPYMASEDISVFPPAPEGPIPAFDQHLPGGSRYGSYLEPYDEMNFRWFPDATAA